MIDLNKIINNYVEKNKNIISKKTSFLETFRKKEDDLKHYDELLSELEKKNIECQLNTFKNIQTNVFYFLNEFNPEDIQDNVENVQITIDFLNQKKSEFSKIAEILSFIQKTWNNFNNRRNKENKTSLFSEEINKKLEKLQNSYAHATDQDINRVEDDANDLKQDLVKIISIFEELHIILDKNVFIGEEAKLLKKDIEEFLFEDFYTSSVLDLIKRKEKINETLKELTTNQTKFIRKKLEVLKIINKNKKDLYFYTVKFDNYILEYQNENIDLENSIIKSTNNFIYIDNYPEKGIFKAEDIKNLMSISEEQYMVMSEFDSKTTISFYLLSFVIILLSLLSTLSLISIFISILLSGIAFFGFLSSFSILKKQIEKKYNLKDVFFFIPTNFYLIKEGDNNFNYKELIFNILIKSDKTILK